MDAYRIPAEEPPLCRRCKGTGARWLQGLPGWIRCTWCHYWKGKGKLDLKRPAHFKQDTPLMQLATINQSMAGHTMNYREGRTSQARYAEVMVQHSDWLAELLPFLRKGAW